MSNVYKGKLVKYIEQTIKTIEGYKASKIECAQMLGKLGDTEKALVEAKKLINEETLHRLIDKELENIQYSRNEYCSKIERLNIAINREETNLHFVKYNICPHELNELDYIDHHTGEEYYKCCLCGAVS